MKILTFLFGLFVLVLIGGFSYFAITDVSIEQVETTKIIPNDRFLK